MCHHWWPFTILKMFSPIPGIKIAVHQSQMIRQHIKLIFNQEENRLAYSSITKIVYIALSPTTGVPSWQVLLYWHWSADQESTRIVHCKCIFLQATKFSCSLRATMIDLIILYHCLSYHDIKWLYLLLNTFIGYSHNICVETIFSQRVKADVNNSSIGFGCFFSGKISTLVKSSGRTKHSARLPFVLRSQTVSTQ